MCHGFINQHLPSSYSTNHEELKSESRFYIFHKFSPSFFFFGPLTQKAHHHPHVFFFSKCFSNVLGRDSQCGVAGERDEEEEEREVCQ